MKTPKCPKCRDELGQTYYYDGYIEVPMLVCECGFRIDCDDYYDPVLEYQFEYYANI